MHLLFDSSLKVASSTPFSCLNPFLFSFFYLFLFL